MPLLPPQPFFFLLFHVALLELAPSENNIDDTERVTFRADQVGMVSVALRDVGHFTDPNKANASELLLLDLDQRALDHLQRLEVRAEPSDEIGVIGFRFAISGNVSEEADIFTVFSVEKLRNAIF